MNKSKFQLPGDPGRKNKNKRQDDTAKREKNPANDNDRREDSTGEVSRPVTNQDEQRQITNAGTDGPMGEHEREGV